MSEKFQRQSGALSEVEETAANVWPQVVKIEAFLEFFHK
jgi:hypothetical protein